MQGKYNIRIFDRLTGSVIDMQSITYEHFVKAFSSYHDSIVANEIEGNKIIAKRKVSKKPRNLKE